MIAERFLNASACGDNCAKWILRIAGKKNLTINLHHIMDFGKDFEAKILNTGEIVCTVWLNSSALQVNMYRRKYEG